MGRPPNDTRRITIVTTPEAYSALEELKKRGLHGASVAAVAEELMRRQLEQYVEHRKIPGEVLLK
jgi:hypothetical protein